MVRMILCWFFLPRRIRLQKVETIKRKMNREERLCFPHPGILLQDAEGESRNVQKNSKEKVEFPTSEVLGQKEKVGSAENYFRRKLNIPILMFCNGVGKAEGGRVVEKLHRSL